MSLDNVNKLDNNQMEIEFTISKAAFDEAVTRVFKKNVGKMNIPGFRKGKAPRNIIEKMYGKGVFYEDALNDLLPGAYEEALKESGAEAVSRPEFDITSIDEDGVKVKAKFYIKPEIELSEYKGLAADKIVRPVEDSAVDAEIERIRNRNARELDVTDRPAQDGDTVKIDYAGSVDGVPFEGGTAEDQSLKLGSHTFIPGYEEQIVGHNIGDSFDVNVTFPEEYHAKELAGKPAVFKVTLKGIQETQLPELDDEFAKDVSDFDTFAEYKDDVRAKIADRYEKNAEAGVEEQLIDDLIAISTVDVPAPMIDAEVENIIRDRDYSMRQQGLSLDMYFKYTGMTLDSMREEVRPQAERQIKTRLALEKIVALENIEATEEDIEAEYTRIAGLYNMSVEDVKKSLTADMLAGDIKLKKAVDFIKANAVITEKPYVAPEANVSSEKTEETTDAE